MRRVDRGGAGERRRLGPVPADTGGLPVGLRDLRLARGFPVVAITGPRQSGKTTLANLVPHFYRPTGGRILLDGIDVESLTLASLRANIALVSQDVVLFNDTVAANIAYGAMRETREAERDSHPQQPMH